MAMDPSRPSGFWSVPDEVAAQLTQRGGDKRRELAATIAAQAQAIADGTVPVIVAMAGLKANVALLEAWMPDDRSGV